MFKNFHIQIPVSNLNKFYQILINFIEFPQFDHSMHWIKYIEATLDYDGFQNPS